MHWEWSAASLARSIILTKPTPPNGWWTTLVGEHVSRFKLLFELDTLEAGQFIALEVVLLSTLRPQVAGLTDPEPKGLPNQPVAYIFDAR